MDVHTQHVKNRAAVVRTSLNAAAGSVVCEMGAAVIQRGHVSLEQHTLRAAGEEPQRPRFETS